MMSFCLGLSLNLSRFVIFKIYYFIIGILSDAEQKNKKQALRSAQNQLLLVSDSWWNNCAITARSAKGKIFQRSLSHSAVSSPDEEEAIWWWSWDDHNDDDDMICGFGAGMWKQQQRLCLGICVLFVYISTINTRREREEERQYVEIKEICIHLSTVNRIVFKWKLIEVSRSGCGDTWAKDNLSPSPFYWGGREGASPPIAMWSVQRIICVTRSVSHGSSCRRRLRRGSPWIAHSEFMYLNWISDRFNIFLVCVFASRYSIYLFSIILLE